VPRKSGGRRSKNGRDRLDVLGEPMRSANAASSRACAARIASARVASSSAARWKPIVAGRS
jgi:hypothetical protein